jgi:hypothetical protein
MDIKSVRGIAVLAAIIGLAAMLGAGAILVPVMREAYVYAPMERRVEEAMRQIAQRERSLREQTGKFVAFGEREIKRDSAWLSISWDAFPVQDFFFEAVPVESGNLRLRALPRADSVLSLDVRARMYLTELSPAGETIRAGWHPEAD